MAVYRAGFSVETKHDDSPVTEADLRAHHVLLEGLAALGDLPILSEEGVEAITPEERLSWRRYWLVDPLDGTREFVNRRDEFTVNVALIEDHRPRLGVVHLPVTGESWWGIPGHGAGRLTASGQHTSIQAAGRAASPVRVLGSHSHHDRFLGDYLEALGPHTLHTAGSSLKFCRIAEGVADLYPRFGPTAEWDTGAGQAVAEAAGAHVIDLDGQPLRYNTAPGLRNGFFLVYADSRRDWLAQVPQHARDAGRRGP
ncbi:MAG: 3'(2'),5'-bisphosphate nucleotidase CysQ [Gammaproteobacteria bacterium]|nr:3'(2'),5'-bisphosphate nucleotidase CysQ [Gammaproteobacteria bacterium]